jgi:tetratricopeptide (TPR) repeat protein
MGERLIYLPAVGFIGCVVCAVELLPRRQAVAAGVMVVCAALAVRTWNRNGDWLDTERFWNSARDAAPSSYKTTLQAALNSRTVGDERSVREVERALSILNGLPDRLNVAFAYSQAGTFYRHLGDLGRAEGWHRRSLEVLLRAERIELAQDEETKRVNAEHGRTVVTSGWGVTLRELGRTYVRLGDAGRAIEAFERGRAVTVDPELLEELASLYRARGELRKAAFALVEALLVDSSRAGAMAQAAELYGAIDPGGCAASLNPSCPVVHDDICGASGEVIGVYTRRGQQWEAGAIRQTAAKELGCAAELLGR